MIALTFLGIEDPSLEVDNGTEILVLGEGIFSRSSGHRTSRDRASKITIFGPHDSNLRLCLIAAKAPFVSKILFVKPASQGCWTRAGLTSNIQVAEEPNMLPSCFFSSLLRFPRRVFCTFCDL